MAASSPALHVKPGTEWAAVLGRASAVAPEAFGTDRLLNLVDGAWRPNGHPEILTSPVDGTKLTGLPRLSAGEAKHAVQASAAAHARGATTPGAARKGRAPPQLATM